MNRFLKKLILATGILVGALLISYSSVLAEQTVESKSTETLCMDLYVVALHEDHEVEKATEYCCQIFNSDNKLVYVSNDKDDPQLKLLLRKSDFVMNTNSSSYYLLGD